MGIERDTFLGFIDDLANATRSGSPAVATSAPDGSTTTTSPWWTDSSSPERL